jgi:signal transduction histidine kinase
MLLVLPAAGIIIYSLIRSHIIDGFEDKLRTYTWVVQAESIGETNTPEKPTNIGEPLFGVTHSGWYWQVQPLGGHNGPRLVSDSLATSTLPSPYEHNAQPDADGLYWLNTKGPLGQPLRVVEGTGRLGENQNGPLYSFVVAGPLDWPESRISSFGLTIAIALALAGLGLIAATFLQVRFGLAPLARVEQGLAAIRSGSAETLEGELPSEIQPLQVELNALIESNQQIIERARTQVGNLAHALKTPLAVITNEAGERATPFAEKVAEQAEIMSSQISLYLDRARMAAQTRTIGRVTEVAPVVEALQRALERIYRDKAIDMAVKCDGQARFQGEQHDLEELLGNLLDNASKWCTRRVRVAIRTTADTRRTGKRHLHVVVEDDGAGLPEGQRQDIVERGVRLDETKPGSGLGLSIVRDLVQLYQGTWSMSQSDLGGLRVDVNLPAAVT